MTKQHPMTEVDPVIEVWNQRIEAIGRSWLSICRSVDPPIHHSLVARWRSGATRPSFRTARRFLAALEDAERAHDKQSRKTGRAATARAAAVR